VRACSLCTVMAILAFVTPAVAVDSGSGRSSQGISRTPGGVTPASQETISADRVADLTGAGLGRCPRPQSSPCDFTDDFFIEGCTFSTTGRNRFFVLEPGFELVLEGEEDGEELGVTITVLDETMSVGGVETRIVREVETVDGELAEISYNYFAMCVETGSVFYFGEDVDIYEGGVVVSHDGAWRAGEDGARAGIMMPGTILVGSRYYQEIAPGVALDRAENVSLDERVRTGAGDFDDCLLVDETTPLEPKSRSVKLYAPGIGLVVDDEVKLVDYTDPARN